jgi:hypothetical protein
MTSQIVECQRNKQQNERTKQALQEHIPRAQLMNSRPKPIIPIAYRNTHKAGQSE